MCPPSSDVHHDSGNNIELLLSHFYELEKVGNTEDMLNWQA